MPQRTSKYPPKTLVKLQPVQVFAATFVDGGQVSDTRFVAVVGENIHFLHPEGVDDKIRQPQRWLKEAIAKRMEEAISGEDIEQEEVSGLPTEAVV
jgi:hypothetical protein